MEDHTKQDIDDLRVLGTRPGGDETENQTRATVKVTMMIKAVSMTADQFQELTRSKLEQVWPEYSGRAVTRVEMTIDQLQILLAALTTRHWRDIEATREGANTPKLDQGDIKPTREGEAQPKLDQVDHEDIEATREGETLPKLDQVDIEATSEGETVPKLDQGEGGADAQVQDHTSNRLRMVIAKSHEDENEAEGVAH